MARNNIKKRALLIGNGVNRLDSNQSFSWDELLKGLKKTYNIDVDLDNVFKPFPLAFDEMLHRKQGTQDVNRKIRTLKKRIRTNIQDQLRGKIGYNDYHKSIASLPYNDIITTNYDYSLANSIIPDFSKEKTKLAINKQERKYSLKRGYLVPNESKVIWHIHGELYDSRDNSKSSKYYSEESIMIGYEHYASYLERIQNNIRGKSGSQKIENQSLRIRLKNGGKSPFWTDIFFTHDIDIVGQGFDFSENHLWWLINFRANSIRNGESRYKIPINNQIRFYYPILEREDDINSLLTDTLDRIVEKSNSIKKSKAVAEVLKAFNVEPKPIKVRTFQEFYERLISKELTS